MEMRTNMDKRLVARQQWFIDMVTGYSPVEGMPNLMIKPRPKLGLLHYTQREERHHYKRGIYDMKIIIGGK